MSTRISDAYETFMLALFGEVPKNPQEHTVSRATYDEKMRAVQEDFNLKEGDPEFLEWIITLLARSPKFEQEGTK